MHGPHAACPCTGRETLYTVHIVYKLVIRNVLFFNHFSDADGCILTSEAAAKELEREQGFTATYNKNIEFAVND